MLKTNIEKHLLIIHLFLFNLYIMKQFLKTKNKISIPNFSNKNLIKETFINLLASFITTIFILLVILVVSLFAHWLINKITSPSILFTFIFFILWSLIHTFTKNS